MLKSLRESGYTHIRGVSDKQAESLASQLGEIVYVTEVTVNEKSRSLVTSPDALPPHTDHHAVRYILWHCREQTSEGGSTYFIDCQDIVDTLAESEKDELASISLFEHKVFGDEPDEYPMFTENGECWQIYYSFWLMKKADRNSAAYRYFRKRVDASPVTEILLQPNEVLILDNHRMLHGRTPINGNKKRHLRRYWIR